MVTTIYCGQNIVATINCRQYILATNFFKVSTFFGGITKFQGTKFVWIKLFWVSTFFRAQKFWDQIKKFQGSKIFRGYNFCWFKFFGGNIWGVHIFWGHNF